MVIKMRRYDIRFHIVRRMLHRCKGIDILSHRQYDNAARMLPRTSSDTRTARHKAVDLARPFPLSMILIIILHIAESRLIRQRSDRSRTVSLSVTENNFRIFMRLTLILSGKIQIDIRLLVPLKPEKRFKRNIEPFLLQRRSADRTILIRHIASGTAAESLNFFGIKIIIMAFGTQIMGTQGINFRNTRHIRHKRRTDGTSGTYQITVLDRFPYQFLRNNVHDRKTVGYD